MRTHRGTVDHCICISHVLGSIQHARVRLVVLGCPLRNRCGAHEPVILQQTLTMNGEDAQRQQDWDKRHAQRGEQR